MDSLCLEGEVVALCLHVGDTLNGHKITKIARNPFKELSYICWTDDYEVGEFGDKSVVSFTVEFNGRKNG